MATHEALTINPSNVPLVEQIQMNKGKYTNYWEEVSAVTTDETTKIIAEQNQYRLNALGARLYNPGLRFGRQNTNLLFGNTHLDDMKMGRVASEWYLGLGSLNPLNDAGLSVFYAAALLWENPKESSSFDQQIVNRFYDAVDYLNDKDKPGRIEEVATDSLALSRISLSAQALLDIARSTTSSPVEAKMHKTMAKKSEKIHQRLFDIFSLKDDLDDYQKRLLSDSLKGTYDAQFEAIELQKNDNSINEISYMNEYNKLLSKQIKSTIQVANKLTNGDLYESYFVALMRYSLNTWREQYNYKVSCATRRQDEPHDRFKQYDIPRISYDAIVSEPISGQNKLIQLKTYHQIDEVPYAEGIDTIDDLFSKELPNRQIRLQINTGLSQMNGLLNEILYPNMRYNGPTNLINTHINHINNYFA